MGALASYQPVPGLERPGLERPGLEPERSSLQRSGSGPNAPP